MLSLSILHSNRVPEGGAAISWKRVGMKGGNKAFLWSEMKQVEGSDVQLQLINDSLFASLTVGEMFLTFSSPHHPQLSFPIKALAK